MYLERLLQINMATLAALGALLLGMGQRSEGPPLLVMLAAAVSVWITDVRGRFRIGRWTANVLMLIGAVLSLHSVYPLRNEAQTTVGLSWFLIYLQIILLFQEKDQWKYWLLIMLSLLEVVMATLFSQGIGFGILLAIYMFLGFAAMTLLMTYRQWELHRKEPHVQIARPRIATRPLTGRPGLAGKAASARWPLSCQQADFSGMPAGSGHWGIGRELFRRLRRMGMQTMMLTLVLFFALPRFGQFTWRGSGSAPVAPQQTLVGFTDKVKLGALGKIIESRDKVMQVTFYKNSNDTAKPLHGDVYLQGAYLLYYRDGQWTRGEARINNPGTGSLQQQWSPPPPGLVRQRVVLESLDRPELFYVAPYVAVERSYPSIVVDYPSMTLLRDEQGCATQFTYVLGTTVIVNGEQLPTTPAADNEVRYDYVSERRFPALVKQAREWMQESGAPKTDSIRVARFLEQKLARSDRFQYSLVGVERDPGIDPIEDFIAGHPQGHCEYFATALTLMLRSQHVPARLVSGFKCDRDAWNAIGGFYQVRQLHAHTWVEAYIPPEQLPAELKHAADYWSKPDDGRSWKQGGWLRLDPTPGGGHGEIESWLAPVRSGFDWLDGAWSKYVVQLDCQRQRDAIYQPIANTAKKAWQEVTNPGRWQAASNSVAVALYLDHLGREVKSLLLSLLGILFLAILGGAGVVLFLVGRRFWRRRMGMPANHRGRRRTEVAFYRRFEQMMARDGLIRGPAQTQREFAIAAGDHLATRTGDGQLSGLAASVAEAFYRIRFGHARLDRRQSEAVDQALARIAAIRKNRRS